MMDYIATEKNPKQKKTLNTFLYIIKKVVCVCKSGKELYIPLKEKK